VHNGGQRDLLVLKDLSDHYQFVLDATKVFNCSRAIAQARMQAPRNLLQSGVRQRLKRTID
jgi:hypothetical protein